MSATDDASAEDEVPAKVAHEKDEKEAEHGTLKYQLLGPSLTKAGQDAVDQQKVSEIIYNASKGSKFFNNEEVRDKVLTEKITKILARKAQLDKLDISHDLRRADECVAELELSRDLSQHIVHLDCDAFYAAVEELDRPELKDVPFAVGKGVITTCNYHARKFGCRSGMAGFVAKKLCPQLICLPQNFAKYTAKAEEVRAVIAQYDPRFESASIDEAYLNITSYCEERQMDPEEAVSQLRAEVHEKTKITVSAGIAPNAKLAKIASNRNKPNGQFRIAADRASIMTFMAELPCRKVNGVGRVFERELAAVGIKTCADIYPQRGYLTKLFGDKAAEFLLQTYLGIGRTAVKPAGEYERKSVGTESTFQDMSDSTVLRNKLLATAEELQGDLERTGFKGRTLCLKVKLHTYEVLTRQTVPPFAIWKKDDLYKYSLPMLTKLEKEIPGMKLRLMGLRVTQLISTKKGGADFFGPHAKVLMNNKSNEGHKAEASIIDDGGEWEVWPEEEFEAAARQEHQEEMAELERLSQEQGYEPETTATSSTQHKHGRILNEQTTPSVNVNVTGTDTFLPCPICSVPQPANDKTFNEHIDYCLSRQTIREAVKDSGSPNSHIPVAHENVPALKKSAIGGNALKRGRPKKSDRETDQRNTKKRLFFT
ncbi:DNA/RNA polymerase [Rhizodiscina lignyota]|uniref:DNA polymerase kappa n=1 Tax=Rhizodiscina lignyota TaxID=1504668 RepID=A0A9P4MEW1_9PEZI|nr:DNA/RNA polymerase [Rhizodiscina lignyota]